jgi:hypothetical protein
MLFNNESMKSMFFTLLLIWVNILGAQNYQNICSPGTTFFKDNSGNLKAFRRDSVVLMGNNDTLFISYNAIRDTTGVCRDTNSGSILGRKILKKQNGWFCFFNRYQDSIKINTQATLHQPWKFCDLASGSYIQAEVTSIISDNVLGATDPVRVITLQAKNSDNNDIPHLLNGRTINLSQHYGLSRMLDVYSIPADTNLYSLAGKSYQTLGLQDITWQDVCNFDIGDIFHYQGYWWTSFGAWYTTRTIETILAKTVFGNNDSISYEIEKCVRMDASYPPHLTTSFDTVTTVYHLIALESDQPLRLPGEFVSSWDPPDYYARINPDNDRLTKGIVTGTNMYNTATGCYTSLFESLYTDDGYSSGLGHTYEFWQYWSDGLYTYNESLVYYKKGSETWGTPVATDCSVLTGIDNQMISPEPSVEVFPNPAETEARIVLHGFNPDDNLSYSLYNYSGIKVYEGKASLNPFMLHRESRASGFYILIISDRNGSIKGKIKVNFK